MSDAYQLLGISRDADDAQVRTAYLAGVRLYPPDRDAERFAAIRRAYESVTTHRKRIEYDLFGKDKPTLEGFLHLLQSQTAPSRPSAATLSRVLKGPHHGR